MILRTPEHINNRDALAYPPIAAGRGSRATLLVVRVPIACVCLYLTRSCVPHTRILSCALAEWPRALGARPRACASSPRWLQQRGAPTVQILSVLLALLLSVQYLRSTWREVKRKLYARCQLIEDANCDFKMW